MGLFEKVLSDIRKRRERAISGKLNCVPNPFPRFRRVIPGVEKGRYIILSGMQKAGKSSLSDYIFVFDFVKRRVSDPTFQFVILYFSLEETAMDKYYKFLSHLLYELDGLRYSPADLKSVGEGNIVPEDIIELLSSVRYRPYIEVFSECVKFNTKACSSLEIRNEIDRYALSHGHENYDETTTIDEVTGLVITEKTLSDSNPYTADDESVYVICLVDNAANIESSPGGTPKTTIDEFSKIAIQLRNKYKYDIVLVQHQNLQKESMDNIKALNIKPSSTSLGDSKTVSRDVDLGIGVYSPAKYNIPNYMGYDITKFKDSIRFVNIFEDRHYGAVGEICPLYFDGACSYFEELPLPSDERGLQKFYEKIDEISRQKGLMATKSSEDFGKFAESTPVTGPSKPENPFDHNSIFSIINDEDAFSFYSLTLNL